MLADFASARGVPVIDLDDPATRDAVLANVASAVGEHTPVCLDEYQHASEVLDALKARLNREAAQPGTAVLTGSTRQDALPRTSQALTGRLHTMTIWPLSQGEMGGQVEDLLPALRSDPDAAVAAHPTSATTRAGYVERVCAGGFPLALRRAAGAARNRWFDDYVTQSIERDAIELARIRQRQLLRELLGRLAGRTGQVLNLSAASEGLGLARTHGRGAHSAPGPTTLAEFGNLLETFVVGELRKQASWLDESVTAGHWRTHDGDEVDYVMEFDDGRVLAFEVKANERVAGSDLKGLRTLRSALGDRFIAGVAFSTGRRFLQLPGPHLRHAARPALAPRLLTARRSDLPLSRTPWHCVGQCTVRSWRGPPDEAARGSEPWTTRDRPGHPLPKKWKVNRNKKTKKRKRSMDRCPQSEWHERARNV